MLGWMFDSMDFLIYVLAIGRLQAYFGFDAATAGLLGTMTLVTAAAGGLVFGVIALFPYTTLFHLKSVV